MELLATLAIGYSFGSLSPAALISKLKKKNLREHGTGNLGASNTLLVFGKALGVFVMVFDILKAFFAAKLAELLFPKLAFSGLIAGFAAIVGHNFPFYLHFKGGKGLAAFGGTVLYCNPLFFLGLLLFGLLLMYILNYSVVMPMSAGVLFPILVYLQSGNGWEAAVAALSSLMIIIMHWSNIEKAKKRTDVPIREFVTKKLFRKN